MKQDNDVSRASMNVPITPDLEEDRVWRQHLSSLFGNVPRNVRDICHYGFTEMFNNVLDHSEGQNLSVQVLHSESAIRIEIGDDGVGIFHKLQTELGLEDERHVVLELAKGKLTTDAERHTGEGIFFATRMFDLFCISSGKLRFLHRESSGDWLLEDLSSEQKGTLVTMEIQPQSQRTTKEVFDRFALSAEDYAFVRTHIPVVLAQYGDENLVSRSQAKRLLARFDRFKEVSLDFAGVHAIGPAFADEIFRVFTRHHSETRLVWENASPEVESMIQRALEHE